MQERRSEQVRVLMPASQQALGDVKAVTSIGNRHGLEEPDPIVGEHATDERDLSRVDAGADVGDELADPMHR